MTLLEKQIAIEPDVLPEKVNGIIRKIEPKRMTGIVINIGSDVFKDEYVSLKVGDKVLYNQLHHVKYENLHIVTEDALEAIF